MKTPETHPTCRDGSLAIVLTGGGARGAYQVGVLRALARQHPGACFPIITGVSAGAINAVHLASHPGPLDEAMEELTQIWSHLTLPEVLDVDTFDLGRTVLRWGTRLISGGSALVPKVRGLVDTAPLRRLLERILTVVDGEIIGIERNLQNSPLRAVALTTINYSTGQTVTWVQGDEIQTWERPKRRSRHTRLCVDHVMASSALPLVFPAIRIGDAWHGDGGIRLSAPLSPAIHLGADRLLIISTRYEASMAEAEMPTINGYPPPAQILGKLLNSVFLDLVDQDVARLRRINHLIAKVPEDERGAFRVVESLVIRPSEDLGRLSAEHEPELPKTFRFLTRGLGTRETKSPDFLSMLMFEPEYLRRLIAIGERDADARRAEIATLLNR